MKKLLLPLVMTLMVMGCDKKPEDVFSSVSQTVSSVSQAVQEQKNPWVYSEKVDKMTDVKEISAQANLVDGDTPNILIETKLSCDSKNFVILLTSYLNDGKNGTTGGVTFRTEKINLLGQVGAVLGVRSGDKKFAQAFYETNYSNQIAGVFSTAPDKYSDDKRPEFIKFVSNTTFPNGTLLIQMPTTQGNPVVTINLDNEKVKSVFDSCLPK